MYILYMLLLLHIKIYFSVIWIFYMSIKFREDLLMIREISVLALGYVRHAFISPQWMRDERTPKDVCGEAKCWRKAEKIVWSPHD